MKKLLVVPALALVLFSCGNKNDQKVTLTFATWEDKGKDFYEGLDNITQAYHKVNPNVDIKMEILPNTQYAQNMQIRLSGNKLPDVYATALRYLNDYKDAYLPINDLQATKDNLFASKFAINGNIYAIPSYAFYEVVYYRKSAFEKLGLKVPTTWPEFLNVVKALKKGGYTGISLGIKDAWTDYPFNEFMPFYEPNGGSNLWNDMAQSDAPFSKGTAFYDAYKKINDLYATKAFGDDPLGTDWTQAQNNFVSGKAAMLVAGEWWYDQFLKLADPATQKDLGMFILPTRNTNKDKFRYMFAADVFVGINKNSKHIKEAKAFLNWYFTSPYYTSFIKWKKVEPSMKGHEDLGNPMVQAAIKAVPNPESVFELPGGTEYNNIAKSINFDVKAMGQEMMQGVNFDKYMEHYNKLWKDAKEQK